LFDETRIRTLGFIVMRHGEQMTHRRRARDKVCPTFEEVAYRAEILIDTTVSVTNDEKAYVNFVHLILLNEMAEVAEHVLVLHGIDTK